MAGRTQAFIGYALHRQAAIGRLKGTVSRYFLLQIFPISAKPLKIALGLSRIFRKFADKKILREPKCTTSINDTGGKFLEQYQTAYTLKEKMYLYVNSTTQRCLYKIIKTFLFEDFFGLLPVSTTPMMHLELRISPRIFEKI
jgi:hypothetical protein